MDKETMEDVILPISSDEYGQSGDYPDSDEDIVTDYHITNLDILQRADRLPTINITPHSPVCKVYSILEDNLLQLRELHENIQHMRYTSIQDSYSSNLRDILFAWNPLAPSVARFSNSCPSLNEITFDPDVFVNSVASSPLHQPTSGKNVQDWLCQPEIYRRRSWSAVEDLTSREKTKYYRQRSISLSSMESEADEMSFIDTVDNGDRTLSGTNCSVLSHKNPISSGSTISTHSLNEADLQDDFGVSKVKRETDPRVLPQRLPLQKSISTPSILAVRDLASEPLLVPTHSTKNPYDGSSEKRRKRGSLFFRKKKDKNKKNVHRWVSACYGSSNVCDFCNKNLNNKPGLYCDYCGITVHQSSCKDNALECVRNKSSKSSVKGPGVTVLNSKNFHAKRGSTCSEANTQMNTSSSQMLYDEKDSELNHGHLDNVNFSDDIPLIPSEFLSESPLTAADLSSDFELGLHENEPDSWTPRVGKEVAKKMKEKEVKRQEHIYEFILTEKHHCITLLVVQKVFVEGLQKYFQMGTSLDRMFPRLADLIELHLEFLAHLRRRQKESSIVSTIADILEEQFSDHNAQKLKSAYGEFCSKHREAVEIYKEYLQSDPRFEQFVRHCQSNPLLKKKGIPECILFITQRLTKYPLLIEPLIKTSRDNKTEQETLQRTLNFVKDILVDVDAQVAQKEKEDRKLEIYNKIDAKSSTVYRGLKFKKSDILQGYRTLKFEGSAMLMQGRTKMQLVLVIVLSDILFFLQESSQKYVFFTPENKAGVISLQKLLVREKAGQDSRGVYLISSNPADPEMFELKVHKPKDKQIWIHAIREAVQTCPEDEESTLPHSFEGKNSSTSPRHPQIRHLIGLLRQKDVEQALLFEEKMALQLKLLTATGIDSPSPPTYRHLVREGLDSGDIWKEVLSAVQEVNRLTSSLFATGTSLSRSVSSAGEHQSESYVSPLLPKRAETFGGFDSSIQNATKEKIHPSNCGPVGPPILENRRSNEFRTLAKLVKKPDPQFDEDNSKEEIEMLDDPAAFCSLGAEQQYSAVQLSHNIYTLLCIISQLMTTNESFQAQLNTLKAGGDGSKLYRHNQQLEELRNLQDKLSAEKTAWITVRDQEAKDLEDKRKELLKLQEQLKSEEEDIKLQREHLFRTMERLTNKGIIISPNVVTLSLPGQPDKNYGRETVEDSLRGESSGLIPALGNIPINAQSTTERKKEKWNQNPQIKSQLPLNLISATNQQKVSQNVQVKQQIPLKLASRFSSSGTANVIMGTSTPTQLLPLKLSQDDKNKRTNASGYHRLSPPPGETMAVNYFHSRTGSSPSVMDDAQSDLPESQPSTQVASCSNTAQKTGDEKVIYF